MTRSLAAGIAAAALWALVAASPVGAEPVLPSGFQDTILPFEGLTPGQGIEEPTAFRFAPDGKVFVAEKSGKVLVYDSPADHTPTLFADLRTEVFNAEDRGLLGLEVDPRFDEGRPYVYVLYAYDAPPGEVAPFWGNPGEDGDVCPDPPGVNTDGCVIQGRLTRLTADLVTDEATVEDPLVTGWCQQFSSHSVGDLRFDSAGNLWASGGEGASFEEIDYGQFGFPQVNPCGDPPAGVGGVELPETSKGGSLRSQNLRNLSGKLIRIDPDTGEGVAGNPKIASADQDERRIVGYGFRNPFRFAIDPTTQEAYVDNVGSSIYEEIDRFTPSSSAVYNSGWPCYEGPERRQPYEELGVCKQLYENPGATSPPFFYYAHRAGVTPEDPCPWQPGAALSGLAFYEGGAYPAAYDGALFFADAVRGCLYVMRAGAAGQPDPTTVEPFLTEGGLYPGVDIEAGPGGDLYYASLYGDEYGPGAIHHISYDPNAPQARLKATTPVWGPKPLTVQFDAGGSTDPQGETLAYEWDLDGDGTFGPPVASSTASKKYEASENVLAEVRVRDQSGHSSVAQVKVFPGDTPPVPQIDAPVESLRWRVGEAIQFAGSATDSKGAVAPERLYWRSRLLHCPGGPDSCHAHPLQVFPGVASGDLIAPDHDLPSYIELTLTATDARGLSASKTVKLTPRAVQLKIVSDPPGVVLTAGPLTQPAPFVLEAIEDSDVAVSAPATAQIGGRTYTWSGWSDGGGRSHTLVALESDTYTATYSGGGKDEAPPPATISKQPHGSGSLVLRTHPPRRTRKHVARFTFGTGSKSARFRCKLDRGPFRTCRSPKTYKRLASGWHEFTVVLVGAGGRPHGKPVRYRWRVR